MHEHSVADAILETAQQRCRAAGATRVRRLVLQVSEFSGLSEGALQMMIDHAAEEMGIEPPEVELVVDGLLGHCPNCGIAPATDELTCKKCGQRGVRPAGDEAMLLLGCDFE